MDQIATQRSLCSDLEAARREFHLALESLSEAGWRKRSTNANWTNGEVLFHTFLAFKLMRVLVPIVRFWGRLPDRYSRRFARILNGTTGPFNALNAFAAHIGARIYTRKRIGRAYDDVHRRLVRRLEAIPDNEWQRGMYYPTRWDALFSEYMTLEQTFAMPVTHLRFHLRQVSR